MLASLFLIRQEQLSGGCERDHSKIVRFWPCDFQPLYASYCRRQNMTEKMTEKTQNAEAQKVQKSEEEWKKELTPEQYQVARQCGTERPFTRPVLEQTR